MDTSYLAFMEFIVVTVAMIGWGALELVSLRRDKHRREAKEHAGRQRALDDGTAGQ
jgi:hypothetical protein